MCLPPSAWLQTAEALRRVAWRSPAPAGLSRTFDGLPVGFEGEVGFGAMFEAARRAGHELRVRSGFRPHDSQHSIFRSWVRAEQARGRGEGDATLRASAYSARPGHSEHQLGTTADLVFRVPHGRMYEGWDPEFIADSAPMRWVAANAHRFGLVLSYGRGKTHATQYVWEPWHYRFVGVEVADAMRRCGLSTEEFLNARYRAGKQPDYLLIDPAVMGASTRLRPPRLAT